MSRTRRTLGALLVALCLCVVAWWVLRLAPTSMESPSSEVAPSVEVTQEVARVRARHQVRGSSAPAAPSPKEERPEGVKGAWLEGRVLESDGRPSVHGSVVLEGVKGTLRGLKVNEEGYFGVSVVPDRYWVHAVRWDGLIQVQSPPRMEVLSEGDRAVMNFELPAHYSGEPGFVASMASDGFEIKWVLADSPARALGLQVGDVILEIDGVSTTDLSEAVFERMLVGPEGTEVDLRMRFEDEEGVWEDTVVLQRSGMDGLFER